MLGKHYSLGSVVEETGEARIKLANFEELKTQGEDVASFLNTFSPDSGFVYLHVIAMGAGEYYGCNINGDYFPERDLINRHNTFVTTAKVFKEHDNKPYSPDYGHVAFSWYNPKMHRVELILAVDKIKGKEFIDRQARGEQLEVSMGCKVAFDVCSICGNKAKKSADYCEHIRRDKKKIYPDGRQPYMINYNPTFFDISIVRRRADRIAYVLSKVASADNSISNLMADEFENLGNDIPFAPEPERAIFDIDEEFEKAASIEAPKSATLAEKIAMVKRISASAVKVLDDSIAKLIPQLESIEPDLPVELLDKMAQKYSLPDILKAFAYRAIPMKPREVTRIIIVQKGLPLTSFNEVLKGVMSAKPGRGNVRELQEATYRHELGSLLDDYLWSRSSFLPAILHRLDLLKGMEKNAASFKLDPIQSYLELDPRLAFGHVRRELPFQNVAGDAANNSVLVTRDPYATTPVQLAPQVLERELRRTKLKDPVLDPLQTALVMGGAYAAYKDSELIRNLVNSPQGAAIIAAIAAALHTKARIPTVNAMQTKVAGIGTDIATKLVLPFVGAHFAAAHYRNKHNRGQDLNAVERFIAENPDVLSIAAPVALHYGLRKHASVNNLPLIDCSGLPGIEKLADATDTAANFARDLMSGIILNSKRRSILSNVIDFNIDSHLINKATSGLSQNFPEQGYYEE